MLERNQSAAMSAGRQASRLPWVDVMGHDRFEQSVAVGRRDAQLQGRSCEEKSCQLGIKLGHDGGQDEDRFRGGLEAPLADHAR